MSEREIVSVRVAYRDGGMWEYAGSALAHAPAPDRLALARALVADMPGVVVGRVPEPIDYIDADECEEQYQFGHNDCRAAMLANGEKNDES